MIGISKWQSLSKDGKVCGMFGCEDAPTNQCPICNSYYCYDHIKIHFHPTGENNSSKNKKSLR